MNKKIFILLLVYLLFSVNNSEAIDIIDLCKTNEDEGFYSSLKPHKPSYFILGNGTPDKKFNNRHNSKFQFSIKQSLCRNFYIAYTQKSIWNIYDESLPFRESNYNPEGFLDFNNSKLKGKYFSFGLLGVEHESNGLSGSNSRSWWKAFWEPKFFIEKTGKDKPYDKFSISLRGWSTFKVGSENSNIKDYMGDGEIKMQYTPIYKLKNNSKRVERILQHIC